MTQNEIIAKAKDVLADEFEVDIVDIKQGGTAG